MALARQALPGERNKLDIGDYYSPFDKIRPMLGWEPRVPLAEWLARIIAFSRQHLIDHL